jgi:hypothetical protein
LQRITTPLTQGASCEERRRPGARARGGEGGVEEPSDAAAPAPIAQEPDLAQLTAEATYHRERLALYRARAYASRPVSPERMRRLEQSSAAADERLQRARAAH